MNETKQERVQLSRKEIKAITGLANHQFTRHTDGTISTHIWDETIIQNVVASFRMAGYQVEIDLWIHNLHYSPVYSIAEEMKS